MESFHCSFCDSNLKRNSKLILHLISHINQLHIPDNIDNMDNHNNKLQYLVFNLNKEVDFWNNKLQSKITNLKKEIRKKTLMNNQNINPKNKRIITDRMFTLFHLVNNEWVKVNDFKSLSAISKFIKLDYNFIYKIYKYGKNPKYKITSTIPNILPNVEISLPKDGIVIC